MTTKKNVLFVLTSVSKNLQGGDTGWYLPEAAHPYYVLLPHHHITFASPLGADPPLDPNSAEMFKDDEESARFLKDDVVKEKLNTALKLSDVKASDYDAIFYVGGHGPVIDLAVDETSIKLAGEFYASGKPTAAVCHGPAALAGVTDAQGKSIFAGRTATGFSNAEEEQVKMVKAVPFLLEDKITEKGGNYVKADEPWGAKVVVDGNVITGQNPASAKGVGEAIKAALE